MGLFDDLLGGGRDNGFDAARELNNKNRKLYERIMLPEYLNFNPENQTSESINYELINEDPVIKSKQLSALEKLAGLSETGLSDVDAAAFNKAKQVGNRLARSGTEAALQNAQARGLGGSGLEFAMREIANQGGAERAQEAGLEQASQAARQRALYNEAYGNALGGLRNQDLNANQANTNIINRFNQLNTQNRQDIRNQNVNQRNQAFQYNEGLKDKRYQNQLGKTDRMAGFNNRDAEIGAAESEQNRRRRSALTGMIGAGAGAYFGGPAGASVGYGIGSSLG